MHLIGLTLQDHHNAIVAERERTIARTTHRREWLALKSRPSAEDPTAKAPQATQHRAPNLPLPM